MEAILILGFFALLFGMIALIGWVKHIRKSDIDAWYEQLERVRADAIDESLYSLRMRDFIRERLNKLEEQLKKPNIKNDKIKVEIEADASGLIKEIERVKKKCNIKDIKNPKEPECSFKVTIKGARVDKSKLEKYILNDMADDIRKKLEELGAL